MFSIKFRYNFVESRGTTEFHVCTIPSCEQAYWPYLHINEKHCEWSHCKTQLLAHKLLFCFFCKTRPSNLFQREVELPNTFKRAFDCWFRPVGRKHRSRRQKRIFSRNPGHTRAIWIHKRTGRGNDKEKCFLNPNPRECLKLHACILQTKITFPVEVRSILICFLF